MSSRNHYEKIEEEDYIIIDIDEFFKNFEEIQNTNGTPDLNFSVFGRYNRNEIQELQFLNFSPRTPLKPFLLLMEDFRSTPQLLKCAKNIS